MLKSQPLPLTTEKNKSAKHKRWLRSRRVIAQLSRWLHIYVSMISFVIVLFFAVTGLTLNHADFFAGELKTANEKGKLDSAWVNTKDSSSINKLNVVEYLRKTYSIKAAVSEFRIEDEQCSISFKGPGYGADAFIDRITGNYDIAIMQTGVIGVLNDLHKGRDSGAGWSVLIDVSAILMTLISLTGIILLLYIKKKRVNGLVIGAIGLLLAWLVYEIWVK
jgi:uncharacterized protein